MTDSEKVVQLPSRGGSAGGHGSDGAPPNFEHRISQLEEGVKELKHDVKEVRLDLAEIKGKLSNLPTTASLLAIMISIWVAGAGIVALAFRLIQP